MQDLSTLLAGLDLKVVEKIEREARPLRDLPTPAPYRSGALGAWTKAMVGSDKKLRRHQALGLTHLEAGDHIVLSTGTASGKSLVFLAPIIRQVLEGEGTALVLYPAKALGADQLSRFRKALSHAGLSPELVGEINGDVELHARSEVLEKCRIILATPDAIHCWLMRQVSSPTVQHFLQSLRYLVLDEAHVFEGVFGSNSAYFFRRLRRAHRKAVARSGKPCKPLQLIAATATIAAPAEHLRQLTGCRFTAITEADNGAPFHGLTLLHVDGPSHGAAAEKMLADICRHLAEKVPPHAFIAFADSRQGVERVTRLIDEDDVLPYRGGYEGRDRAGIEEGLRENRLRGVVATSALELGIDIPQFVVGLNLGVPQTLKALRQRIGRIGRSTPGVFIVIAPASSFVQLGGSFREYLEREVEPSRLYLDNHLVQFQAARCLLEEDSDGTGLPDLADEEDWPSGFPDMLAAALPGAIRPRDLDQLASMGCDSAHFAYPLRAICETKFALRDAHSQEIIGTIELEKALREAYPGATYHHLRRTYRVVEWRSTSYERSILLRRVKAAQNTQALLSTQVSASTQPGEIIDGRLLSGDVGVLAEMVLRVTDSVEGYRIGSTALPYRELSQTDRRMTRKYREFTTTGILCRVEEEWFRGDSDVALRHRQAVADALAAVVAREYNVAPSDIRTAHTRIAVCGPDGPRRVEDAVVIFDNVVGGLRLTSPLFSDFEQLLGRLHRAADLAGEEALLSSPAIDRLAAWRQRLSPSGAGLHVAARDPEDGLLIFAPGSEVALRVNGNLVERTLLEPRLFDLGDGKLLMYRYETSPGVSGWVPHGQVEPIGHNWHHAVWDPVSNEVREIAA
ncbi:DEAD/DEAH box helicase [Sphingosinicella sp. LY1275]|uniref:DEAD/DEAH box helicase n=1 Tax=Sphingosinicella sp. LY1275 TaxID=3095379 RepID=UPI002ADEC9BB|nr:DEAD/DEAH box helicase [Sphingosinicella sp. LY1275]MEA1015150.1 DEAD/DEAH box helicase [Sphingosinicella sp. LY1275]